MYNRYARCRKLQPEDCSKEEEQELTKHGFPSWTKANIIFYASPSLQLFKRSTSCEASAGQLVNIITNENLKRVTLKANLEKSK